MSQENENTEGTTSAPDVAPAQPAPITIAEFRSVDFQAVIGASPLVDPGSHSDQFAASGREAEARNDTVAQRVYSLLAQLCMIHLRPDDRAEPWGPMMSMGDRRTAIPSDFKGQQNDELFALLDDIQNPGLQARLADIVWSNDRKLARAGTIAIEAYQRSIDGLLAGDFKPHIREGRASFEALEYLQRAASIAHATTKKSIPANQRLPESLKASALGLYEAAKQEKEYVVFSHTADIALRYDLIDRAKVAADCEELAQTDDGRFTMPVKGLWEMAARLHRGLDDKDGEGRCKLRSIHQTLEMRKQVNSAGAEAHWVQQALRELLHVDGQAALEDQLLLDLRRLQRASLKEMGRFSIPLDVADEREKVERIFQEFSFVKAMRNFGLLTSSVPVSTLRQRALDSLREHPLQAFMAVGHIDHEGKPIAQAPGAETNGEQSEEWFRAQSLQGEDIRRLGVIAGFIEPARLAIHSRFRIEERHLAPIVMRSPFVPPSQKDIFTLGLARYFQGDFISAVHLLILQLEPSMRHILKLNGHNPVRQYDDGTEEDYDLNAMLTHLRPELERIFGVDWVYEIDLLFVGRPGPSLRNDLAHGHVSTGGCFNHNTVYGCWMLYRLCMIFLLPHWDQLAPELAAVE